MSEQDFIKGMIAGLKVSQNIIENAATESEITYAIKGAILCLEYVKPNDEIEYYWPPAPFTPNAESPKGWRCYRCDRVNAPWMPCCLCNSKDGK